MSGLRIPKLKSMSMKKLSSYLMPEEVCIPLYSFGNVLKPKVNKGDYVYKGQILGISEWPYNIPIFSSVSGWVLDFSEVMHQSGKLVQAVVIKNDYKETLDKKYELRKQINKMSKKEFVDKLEKFGIVGMGGSGFPTFMKYKTEKKINTLIINAVECEPYITSDYTVFMEKCEEILEIVDDILEINDIDEAIIAVKETNLELISKINKYLGTYLRIKICEVPNLYPMGWERTLIKKIKNVDYDKIPSERGIVVNNVSTIYAISQVLKFDKPIIERVVTFTGEGLKKPQNVLVKIGTKVKDVIKELGGKYKNTIVIANGPMMGHLANDNLVVTPDLNCVLVLKENKDVSTKECMRCGKCASVCPANLCPVLIKDNIDDKEMLKKLKTELCSECGLCTYICPSRVDIREYVKKAKDKMKEGM